MAGRLYIFSRRNKEEKAVIAKLHHLLEAEQLTSGADLHLAVIMQTRPREHVRRQTTTNSVWT
jgi:hypothetical protein